MRREKLQAKWFLSVLCGVLFFLTSAFFPKSGALLERVSAEAEMKDSGLNYAESTENIVNPERGFYQALGRSIPAEGREAWWSEETFAAYTRSFGIIHLRLGLESFSSAAGGKDSPVSEDALAALSATLDALRQAGGTAIVRFSYNYEGKTVDGRYVDWEPAPELIETHIAQLGGVLARNTDVVAAVETGMLGPWGEQHSTALATSGEEIFYRIVEAWLRAIPSNRTVSVRRPLYYTYWANRKYGTNLTPENLSGDIATVIWDRTATWGRLPIGRRRPNGSFRGRGRRCTAARWWQIAKRGFWARITTWIISKRKRFSRIRAI